MTTNKVTEEEDEDESSISTATMTDASTTVEDRVRRFVDQVFEVHEDICRRNEICLVVCPLPYEQLVQFASRMLHIQSQFIAQGKPRFVDLGYHYTHTSCMASIQEVCRLKAMPRALSAVASYGIDPLTTFQCCQSSTDC
jgi:hypothetical protein